MASLDSAPAQKCESARGYNPMADLPTPLRVRDDTCAAQPAVVAASDQQADESLIFACPWDSLAQFFTLPELEGLACASAPVHAQLTIEEASVEVDNSEAVQTQRVCNRKMLSPLLVLKVETAEEELKRISLGNVRNLRVVNYKSLDMLCETLSTTGGPAALRSLERVKLAGVPLTPDVISSFIFPAFSHTQLKHLNLERNQVGDDMLIDLVKSGALDAGCLESMNLRFNRISSRGVEVLAASPCCRALKWINLKMNQIGDDGAIALAEMLQTNTTMSLLNLRRQTPVLTDRSAFAFADMLKVNGSLEQLRFRTNRITDEGTLALAAAVPEHVRRLQSFLGIGARFELDLEQNRVKETGARALLESLKGMSKAVRVELLINGNWVKREALATADASEAIDERLKWVSKAEGLLW